MYKFKNACIETPIASNKRSNGGAYLSVMMSVIIPTLNEECAIGQTLTNVAAIGGRPEVIVVDGGSSDRTIEIAHEHGAIVYSCEPGRARQLNLGARRSTGDILLFLHADTHLPSGTLRLVRSALSDPSVGGGSFRLKFDNSHPVLRFSAWMSRLKSPLIHYGDSGYFVRKSAFEDLGGFEDLDIFEDLDFYSRLNRNYGTVIVKDPVVTSSRRFVERGVVKMQSLSILMVILYMIGIQPNRLRKIYDNLQRPACS